MRLASFVRVLRKLLVSGFVAFHVASVLWWNIPANGFPAGDRAAALPAWFLRAEDALFAWKRRVGPRSALAAALESYTVRTATWQQWWMFAPNPLGFHRYIRVHAVIGTSPEGTAIYDPEPLYTSYRGSLDEELRRFSHLSALFAPYTHDHKFVENLSMGDFDRQLDQFARWWGETYARRTGRRPLGVHVLCSEYALPPAFSGVRPWEIKPREWVLWWVRY
jgi:hypothetical protein